jgi:hypothetical protein
MTNMRAPRFIALGALLAIAAPVRAEPVAVKRPEGPSYVVLWLGTPEGKRLADGEMVQTIVDGNVDSRLSFHFKDGSVFDETVIFSQDRVFRLLSYSLVEKGPSFGEDRAMSFDRKSGRYRVLIKDRESGEEEKHEGELAIPEDVYNGMSGLLIRNAGEDVNARLVAFTPEPRMLESSVKLEGDDAYIVGNEERRAKRYLLDLELEGAIGLLAKAVGKAPPDVRYWIAEPVPALLEFEGAMYLNGPVWRIEPTRAKWRKK